ncbi:trafficking protein particle complex subunit 5 [Hordeum vulgare]|nr:trafficking protein particle complex subunit 5 [Hordeum vulgare]
MRFVRNALHIFGEASGLKVNYTKSSAILIRGNEQDQQRVADVLQCQAGEFPCKYLVQKEGTQKPLYSLSLVISISRNPKKSEETQRKGDPRESGQDDRRGEGKTVSLSAFAFLFSELVQYNQTQVDNIAELERRLEDAGYAVGARVLELLCHREKGNRRETRLLGILSFIHSTVWKVLFGKVADSLEKGTEHEDEYMISEKELLVNRFISVPKDMGAFNCGAFVAGIVRGVLDNAGFPAVVTAHFVPIEGQQRPRTTILIKFAEEVIHREARLG